MSGRMVLEGSLASGVTCNRERCGGSLCEQRARSAPGRCRGFGAVSCRQEAQVCARSSAPSGETDDGEWLVGRRSEPVSAAGCPSHAAGLKS